MAQFALLRFLLLSCLLRFATASDALYVYSTSSLKNVTASESCISALASSVTCYSSLSRAVTQTNTWSSIALERICTSDCTNSLQEYIVAVDDACGLGQYNISGVIQEASAGGQRLLWKQAATCLTDTSTGAYCATEFEEAANGTWSGSIGCSQCYLDYLYTLSDSEYGQGLVTQSYFEERAGNCSATGYTFTYTATSTSAAAVATATSNARCNLTDSDTRVYDVLSGDTCIGISAAQNVSTGLLASVNALDQNCTRLSADDQLCLPDVCEIYMVQQNDTCDSVVSSLARKVSVQTLLSWNGNINSQCLNMAGLVGTYICVRCVDPRAPR
jgi:hypothetical protein